MKGMASTPDYYVPPAEGPHPATVIAAEPGLSKKGNTQIHIQVQLDGMSEVIDDYIGTDGSVKGASMSKTKLRGLGIDVTSDTEIPDEQVAAQLLNRKIIVEVSHENAQRKAEDGTYVNATHFDDRTGQTIALKRAVAKGYRQANVGNMATAPRTQPYTPPPQVPSPQQFAQQAPVAFAPQSAPPQQFQQAPQQFAQQAPQQFAQAPQQYAQQPQQFQQAPQGWQQAPQQFAGAQVPMQYAQAPQVPQQAPVQFAPPAAPAPVPWATAPTETNGVATEEKKKRKSKVADEAQG